MGAGSFLEFFISQVRNLAGWSLALRVPHIRIYSRQTKLLLNLLILFSTDLGFNSISWCSLSLLTVQSVFLLPYFLFVFVDLHNNDC